MSVTIEDVERLQSAIKAWGGGVVKSGEICQKVVEQKNRFDVIVAALNAANIGGQPVEQHLADMAKELSASAQTFRELSAAASDVVLAARKAEKQIKKFIS